MRTLQSSKNEVDLNFLNYEFEVTFSVVTVKSYYNIKNVIKINYKKSQTKQLKSCL